MVSRTVEMEAIFNELSERNKEIVILVAKSVKVALQEVPEQPGECPNPDSEARISVT